MVAVLNRTRALTLMAIVLALLSIACFAIPFYVIWPFRRQGETELGVALFVTRIGPWISVLSAVACVFLSFLIFRRTSKWAARTLALLTVTAALSGAFLTRVNVYELMFHHLDRPEFNAADRANLDPDDMVIAVSIQGARRAYPIREVAYHHVVNDTVGGEPIVATY